MIYKVYCEIYGVDLKMYYFRLTLKLSKHKDHDWNYFFMLDSKNEIKVQNAINKLIDDLGKTIRTPLKVVNVEPISEEDYYAMKSK